MLQQVHAFSGSFSVHNLENVVVHFNPAIEKNCGLWVFGVFFWTNMMSLLDADLIESNIFLHVCSLQNPVNSLDISK